MKLRKLLLLSFALNLFVVYGSEFFHGDYGRKIEKKYAEKPIENINHGIDYDHKNDHIKEVDHSSRHSKKQEHKSKGYDKEQHDTHDGNNFEFHKGYRPKKVAHRVVNEHQHQNGYDNDVKGYGQKQAIHKEVKNIHGQQHNQQKQHNNGYVGNTDHDDHEEQNEYNHGKDGHYKRQGSHQNVKSNEHQFGYGKKQVHRGDNGHKSKRIDIYSKPDHHEVHNEQNQKSTGYSQQKSQAPSLLQYGSANKGLGNGKLNYGKNQNVHHQNNANPRKSLVHQAAHHGYGNQQKQNQGFGAGKNVKNTVQYSYEVRLNKDHERHGYKNIQNSNAYNVENSRRNPHHRTEEQVFGSKSNYGQSDEHKHFDHQPHHEKVEGYENKHNKQTTDHQQKHGYENRHIKQKNDHKPEYGVEKKHETKSYGEENQNQNIGYKKTDQIRQKSGYGDSHLQKGDEHKPHYGQVKKQNQKGYGTEHDKKVEHHEQTFGYKKIDEHKAEENHGQTYNKQSNAHQNFESYDNHHESNVGYKTKNSEHRKIDEHSLKSNDDYQHVNQKANYRQEKKLDTLRKGYQRQQKKENKNFGYQKTFGNKGNKGYDNDKIVDLKPHYVQEHKQQTEYKKPIVQYQKIDNHQKRDRYELENHKPQFMNEEKHETEGYGKKTTPYKKINEHLSNNGYGDKHHQPSNVLKNVGQKHQYGQEKQEIKGYSQENSNKESIGYKGEHKTKSYGNQDKRQSGYHHKQEKTQVAKGYRNQPKHKQGYEKNSRQHHETVNLGIYKEPVKEIEFKGYRNQHEFQLKHHEQSFGNKKIDGHKIKGYGNQKIQHKPHQLQTKKPSSTSYSVENKHQVEHKTTHGYGKKAHQKNNDYMKHKEQVVHQQGSVSYQKSNQQKPRGYGKSIPRHKTVYKKPQQKKSETKGYGNQHKHKIQHQQQNHGYRKEVPQVNNNYNKHEKKVVHQQERVDYKKDNEQKSRRGYAKSTPKHKTDYKNLQQKKSIIEGYGNQDKHQIQHQQQKHEYGHQGNNNYKNLNKQPHHVSENKQTINSYGNQHKQQKTRSGYGKSAPKHETGYKNSQQKEHKNEGYGNQDKHQIQLKNQHNGYENQKHINYKNLNNQLHHVSEKKQTTNSYGNQHKQQKARKGYGKSAPKQKISYKNSQQKEHKNEGYGNQDEHKIQHQQNGYQNQKNNNYQNLHKQPHHVSEMKQKINSYENQHVQQKAGKEYTKSAHKHKTGYKSNPQMQHQQQNQEYENQGNDNYQNLNKQPHHMNEKKKKTNVYVNKHAKSTPKHEAGYKNNHQIQYKEQNPHGYENQDNSNYQNFNKQPHHVSEKKQKSNGYGNKHGKSTPKHETGYKNNHHHKNQENNKYHNLKKEHHHVIEEKQKTNGYANQHGMKAQKHETGYKDNHQIKHQQHNHGYENLGRNIEHETKEYDHIESVNYKKDNQQKSRIGKNTPKHEIKRYDNHEIQHQQQNHGYENQRKNNKHETSGYVHKSTENHKSHRLNVDNHHQHGNGYKKVEKKPHHEEGTRNTYESHVQAKTKNQDYRTAEKSNLRNEHQMGHTQGYEHKHITGNKEPQTYQTDHIHGYGEHKPVHDNKKQENGYKGISHKQELSSGKGYQTFNKKKSQNEGYGINKAHSDNGKKIITQHNQGYDHQNQGTKKNSGYKEPKTIITQHNQGYDHQNQGTKKNSGYKEPKKIITQHNQGYNHQNQGTKKNIGYKEPKKIITEHNQGYDHQNQGTKKNSGYKEPKKITTQHNQGYDHQNQGTKKNSGYKEPKKITTQHNQGYDHQNQGTKKNSGYKEPKKIITEYNQGYGHQNLGTKKNSGYKESKKIITEHNQGYDHQNQGTKKNSGYKEPKKITTQHNQGYDHQNQGAKKNSGYKEPKKIITQHNQGYDHQNQGTKKNSGYKEPKTIITQHNQGYGLKKSVTAKADTHNVYQKKKETPEKLVYGGYDSKTKGKKVGKVEYAKAPVYKENSKKHTVPVYLSIRKPTTGPKYFRYEYDVTSAPSYLKGRKSQAVWKVNQDSHGGFYNLQVSHPDGGSSKVFVSSG